MAKEWVLDTETKGTGAHMVPLETVSRRPAAPEPVFVERTPAKPREPQAPEPRAPRKFKIVDLMTRRDLAVGVGAREAAHVLRDIRSVVDFNVYTWEDGRADWRLLTFPERQALWELAHS